MTLADKEILVLGGSSGIGFGVAQAAHDAGAAVTIASRSAQKVEAAAARIGCSGAALDTHDAAALEALFADRRFDHVFCSAAATNVAPVRELPLDEAHASFESKFWGAYRVARAANIAPGGSLTFVSGFLAHRPKNGAAIQGAINAALEGLTRGLALELAPVRVNCISPGLVKTPMLSGKATDARAAMFEGAAEKLPAGRITTPEDIAIQALALMANPAMTGATVLVDGGGAIA